MFLTYNDIELDIEHVVSYEQTPVYDPSGVDYLYTHHRIVVQCVYNPNATASFGNVAPLSIAALRTALTTPRCLLLFNVPNSGGVPNNLLTSPWRDENGDRLPCDAKNGPSPIGEPIITIVGQKTAIVQFAIETWLNECTHFRPILSHRWEMSQDIDVDCYTTRTVTGIAIMRADFLASRTDAPFPASPDDFRYFIRHPIPNNFQRTRISVKVSSDNTTLQYTYVDVEQPSNITPPFQKVTRIGVTYTSWEGVSTANPSKAGEFAFPRRNVTLNVRAWGRREATRSDLGSTIATIAARFRFNDQAFLGVTIPAFFFSESTFIYDAYNRYMEGRFVADSAGLFARLTQVAGIGPYSFDGDPTRANPVLTVFPIQTSNPINGGTTGGWIQRCVAQVLSSPCADPELPPNQTQVLPPGGLVVRGSN